MYMNRGDSESIVVSLSHLDGTPMPLVAGDTIYFTVKESINTSVKVLQKVITTFNSGVATIYLIPSDTKALNYGEYVYDVQYSRSDGIVKTIIGPTPDHTPIFEIGGEVTYE